MNRLAVLALRVLLVILFLGTLLTQAWYIPQFAANAAQAVPELAYLAVPYTIVCIVIVACVQAVFVAMWALLSMVRRGAIFTGRAFRWVDLIIVAGIVATLLTFAIEFHLLGIVDVGPPVLGVAMTGVVIAGAAFVSLMVVMRNLLRAATALQDELAEVV
ncbi:DUF2975 domain-containing protein [Compostimonas suwonensis]|uniref:DUF2975 family protein n=1 Tax=Compostimonas suwonensis TaxID=1048394 RepID=A0A2M9BYX2_9MICO|nr:DUF2975 domain-containing protein [Compostimonas suwonensis]PJJ63279.1 Protein of unknown function (DUF2975) [Compostimonas suwonensis]